MGALSGSRADASNPELHRVSTEGFDPARIDQICANSFRNFHAKGLDYLCLHRSLEWTLKVYFFDGDLSKLPELVVPHNHRYHFSSRVVAGAVSNVTYHLGSGDIYDAFDFYTPLNGGDGFVWRDEVRLCRQPAQSYSAGEEWWSGNAAIHTLRIDAAQSILMLEQFSDVVALGVPSQAYRRGGERQAPSLDGLYDEMTPDHARRLLLILANANAIAMAPRTGGMRRHAGPSGLPSAARKGSPK